MGKIIGALFRNFVGAPPRIEGLKRRANLYQEVFSKRDEIKSEALRRLADDSYWGTLNALENSLPYRKFASMNDFTLEFESIREQKAEYLANYINSGKNEIINTIINYLKMYQKKYHSFVGFSDMSFDSWDEIDVSGELALEIYTEIINSRDYLDAEKIDNIIKSYYKRKMLKKGMRR